jgi:hypothetical protein
MRLGKAFAEADQPFLKSDPFFKHVRFLTLCFVESYKERARRALRGISSTSFSTRSKDSGKRSAEATEV